MPASAAPESILRDALDRARAENAALQDRVRALEDTVRALKRTVFLLTTDPSGPEKPQLHLLLPHPSQSPQHAPQPKAHATNATASVGGTPNDGVGASPKNDLASSLQSQFQGAVPGTVPVAPARASSVVDAARSTGSEFAPLVERVELKGHGGAVYAVRFSSDGSCLVSTSFDRSVRVWPMNTHLSSENASPILTIADAHRAPVVTAEWLHHVSGRRLVTGGFDASAAEWDVEAALTTPISRVHTRGLVNTVATSSAHPHIFFTGTARGAVHMFDRRAPSRNIGSAVSASQHTSALGPAVPLSAAARGPCDEATIIVDNDTPVNSIHVECDGLRILTGDHAGAIKAWDLRMVTSRAHAASGTGVFTSKPAALVGTMYSDATRRPITHIHTAPPVFGDDSRGRLLAVNSYGPYLRVFDRGSFQMDKTKSFNLKPLHALRGVVNRNWPIKSSFYVGPEYLPNRTRRPRQAGGGHRRPTSALPGGASSKSFARSKTPGPKGSDSFHSAHGRPSSSTDVLDASVGGPLEQTRVAIESSSDELDSDSDQNGRFDSETSSDDDEEHIVQRGAAPLRTKGQVYRPGKVPIQSSLLLASGSADGVIHLFDVGGDAGTGVTLQTIRGHRDRVHSVEFHPTEPILASASADSVVKIWS